MIRNVWMILLTTLFLMGVAGVLTSCNTVEGAGKDIESGGKAIKDEANRNMYQ